MKKHTYIFIFFCNRGEETEGDEEMLKKSQVTNPDEINLDEFESDEEEKIEGKIYIVAMVTN